jgi:2-keto-3-deoxy-galactonokinase
MGEILLVLDEGTASTRAMLLAPDGKRLGVEQPGDNGDSVHSIDRPSGAAALG